MPPLNLLHTRVQNKENNSIANINKNDAVLNECTSSDSFFSVDKNLKNIKITTNQNIRCLRKCYSVLEYLPCTCFSTVISVSF